jgi:hypothetical protein
VPSCLSILSIPPPRSPYLSRNACLRESDNDHMRALFGLHLAARRAFEHMDESLCATRMPRLPRARTFDWTLPRARRRGFREMVAEMLDHVWYVSLHAAVEPHYLVPLILALIFYILLFAICHPIISSIRSLHTQSFLFYYCSCFHTWLSFVTLTPSALNLSFCFS